MPSGHDYKPTKANRNLVAFLAAEGQAVHQIAAALGVSPETIRRHYSEEITDARALIQAKLVDMLMRAAQSGNVSAQKYLHGRLNGEKTVGYVSKKRLAQIEAETAGQSTEWGDDLKAPLGTLEN